jgi:hypothetical protein
MFKRKPAATKEKSDQVPEEVVPGEMNFLTSEEITVFREEFQEKEREIQRNIGIYLSGLVLVTGWLIGPQTKPLIKMALDNYGYNLFGFLGVVALNVVFTCFLIYKSLIVHEITQFIAVHSKPHSVFNYWEAWRRSDQSVTKPVRIVNSVILAVLPVFVSAAILLPVGLLLFFGDSATLSAELRQLDVKGDGTLPVVFTTPEQLSYAFFLVRIGFVFVFLLHLLPIWFLYENVKPTNERWDKIHANRVQAPNYKDLDRVLKYVEADGDTKTSQKSSSVSSSEFPENPQARRKMETPERGAKKSKRSTDDPDYLDLHEHDEAKQLTLPTYQALFKT